MKGGPRTCWSEKSGLVESKVLFQLTGERSKLRGPTRKKKGAKKKDLPEGERGTMAQLCFAGRRWLIGGEDDSGVEALKDKLTSAAGGETHSAHALKAPNRENLSWGFKSSDIESKSLNLQHDQKP